VCSHLIDDHQLPLKLLSCVGFDQQSLAAAQALICAFRVLCVFRGSGSINQEYTEYTERTERLEGPEGMAVGHFQLQSSLRLGGFA